MSIKKKNKSFITGFIDRMFPSMIAGQIVATICTIIDTALTGKFLGDQALAAEGMASPVFLVVAALACIMAAGNTNICSNESGKGNIKEMSKVFSMTLFVSCLVSVLFTIIILIFSRNVCAFLGLEPGTQLFELTWEYMVGYVLMMPAASIVMILPGILQIEGDNITSVVALVLLFIADIILDFLNIFVFHAGVLGMALATTVSYYIASIVIVAAFIRKKHLVKFSLKNLEFKRLKEVLSYGTPSFIKAACLGVISAAINAAFLHFGTEIYVSAFTIVGRVGELFLCFGMGMCELVAMISGVINGEEDRNGLKEIIGYSIKKMTIINVILTIIAFAVARLAVLPFTSEPDTISIAAFGLRIFCLQLVFKGIFECFIGYLRGIQRFILGNIMLLVLAGLTCLTAWVLPLIAGVNSIWFSYVIAAGLSVLAMLLYVKIYSHSTPFRTENMILKPESFGVSPENYLEKQILSMPELMDYSERAAEFVKEHGGSTRQAYLLPLCIEEMGKNIISYGFSDDEEHSMVIKVLYSEDGFMLRIRDDCKHFNPEDFYKMHSEDDLINNFGIRIVFRAAREVIYMNTLKLNNLLVKI